MSRIAWSRGYQEYIRGREEIRADTWQACADAMQDALTLARSRGIRGCSAAH
jgi:hypothetical protein